MMLLMWSDSEAVSFGDLMVDGLMVFIGISLGAYYNWSDLYLNNTTILILC